MEGNEITQLISGLISLSLIIGFIIVVIRLGKIEKYLFEIGKMQRFEVDKIGYSEYEKEQKEKELARLREMEEADKTWKPGDSLIR